MQWRDLKKILTDRGIKDDTKLEGINFVYGDNKDDTEKGFHVTFSVACKDITRGNGQ